MDETDAMTATPKKTGSEGTRAERPSRSAATAAEADGKKPARKPATAKGAPPTATDAAGEEAAGRHAAGGKPARKHVADDVASPQGAVDADAAGEEAAGERTAGGKPARKHVADDVASPQGAVDADAAGEEAAGRHAAGGKPARRRAVVEATSPRGTAAAGGEADRKHAGSKGKASKDAAVRKTAAGRVVGKGPGGKGSAVEGTAGRTGAGRAAAHPVAAGKTGGEEAVTERTATEGPSSEAAGKSTAKKAGAARAAKQTGATTVVAKKTPGTAAAKQSAVPKARLAAAEPGDLAVRPGEDPWTPEEVADARTELSSEVDRLRTEISTSESALVGLMRDSGDGAGDDQADTGTKNITREHEMALAANAREMLTQNEHALERLDAGTYGLCENCGDPIGKARMQAFPRATLCVECKQKQERRS
ncbi:TraR/DksA family transcriptional regulator [Streptomyces sp. YKOK-J1]